MLNKVNKIFISYLIYIKCEFYLNFFFINFEKKFSDKFNLININFYKVKIINKILNSNFKNRGILLNCFNLSDFLSILKNNKIYINYFFFFKKKLHFNFFDLSKRIDYFKEFLNFFEKILKNFFFFIFNYE